MIVTSKAMELERRTNYLSEASALIIKDPISPHWFDIYEEMIEQLVVNESFPEADLLINSLQQLPLRERYHERLSELKEWRDFVYSEYQTTNNPL
ncbi:MAG TPA: hypothetical protein DCL80_03415 [Balneola sp.]|nr:hypothetical protein [Balneola sp.]